MDGQRNQMFEDKGVVAIMTTRIIIFMFSFSSILTLGQTTEKLNFKQQLNDLKKFDNLVINDSIKLIAELKDFKNKTNTYLQCNILIPHDKENVIEIETQYISYNDFLSYSAEKTHDTLIINYWYPIMTDTLGAYTNKIVKKEYLINDSGKLKKTIELKSYSLTNSQFSFWYENHINKAIVLKSVEDLNILFTIINSNLKSNDFFLNNNYQTLTKCFGADYYAIRSLLWNK